ncbi:MAG: nickel-dependent hydrogenase large subunit [Candidatus Bathyarchaeota archaeon]|nr:MAG: nickel-dependent hydrogenase large subunit [Candidatus Bathyarchaeota archaeon]
MKEFTVFPFGPQHPVLPEPLQLRFTVDEERIVEVVPNIGYVHRGIERACELNDYRRNIYLCERICGICNFMHAMSYCEAIEKITDTDVPARARYLRTIWSELSRLQSHLLWLGLFADGMGFESLFMQLWRDREIILELTEKTAGHRIQLSTCAIGGVRKDMDESLIGQYRSGLAELTKKVQAVDPVFRNDSAVKSKTVGKGILPRSEATHLGAVGPTIRGSGVPQDLRTLGYEAYGELDFAPITHDTEDAYSRTLVRLDEVYQSIDLINQALVQMPEGPILQKSTKFPEGTAINRVEQPRGEAFYYIVGDGTIHLERVRVRTPTFANIPALLSILVGHEIADIPPIVLSIDPCMSCTERITYVKEDE